jgi:hypothetical protein
LWGLPAAGAVDQAAAVAVAVEDGAEWLVVFHGYPFAKAVIITELLHSRRGVTVIPPQSWRTVKVE